MGILSTLFLHPDEIISLLRVRQLVENAKRLPQDPDLAFCYDMLNRVSRSFAVVIQQLGPELRDPVSDYPWKIVCLFLHEISFHSRKLCREGKMRDWF